MKKIFKSYAICWALVLAAFNVICFVIPRTVTLDGMVYTKFDGAFWAGYVFITLAFLGQLVCAFYAFRESNLQKLFYNLSLVTISYTGVILMLVFGGACMVIPNLPNWAGIIVCVLILVFTAVAVVKASVTAEVNTNIDNKVKAQTALFRTLTAEAEALVNRTGGEKSRAACKKVYEALRYSDPVSSEALTELETEISVKIGELAAAVKESRDEKVSEMAENLVSLINERNRKCKAGK